MVSSAIVAFASGMLSSFDSKPIMAHGGQHILGSNTQTHIKAQALMITLKPKCKKKCMQIFYIYLLGKYTETVITNNQHYTFVIVLEKINGEISGALILQDG